MNRRFLPFLAILFAFASLLVLPALAALTGDLQGTVLDSNGLSVSGATVTIKNLGTDVTRTVTTTSQGEFSAQQLDIGSYELTIEKQGFAVSKTQVVIRSGEVTRLNFTLQVGKVNEVVTVEAGAEAFLDTANSQISTSIGEQEIKDLPIINRDPLAFATLSPGITPVSKDNPFLGSGSFNANGQRGRANNITIDNAVASDISTTGGAGLGTFSLDEVQEFKLITDNFSAEFGRNSGAQVQLITKSGTNQYHGSVYEFHQDAAGNARDFFNAFTPAHPNGQVTPVVNNLWGFAAGGPVVKDHLFVFGHYEGNKIRGAGSTSSATVLTPSQVAGITDPTSKALFQAVGAPTSATDANPHLSNSAPNATDTYSWALRVDESWRGGKDVLTSRYGTDPLTQVRPGLVFVGTSLPNYGANVTNTARTYNLGETHIFSPAIVNQARFTFSRTKPIFLPFTTLPPPFAPLIQISGLAAMGEASIIPQGRTENDFEYSDIVSWSRGRHGLKFGVDAFRYQQNSFFDSNFRGTFLFPSVLAFQTGSPSSFSQNVGNSVRGNRNTDVFGFGQDDFRLTNSLTLNLGVRLESAGGVSEVRNILSNIDPNNTQPLGGGGTGPLGGVDLGGTAFQRNYNWAPRVGAAWNPHHGKLVFRGGYGWAYDFIYQNPITNLRFAPPFIPSVTLNTFTGANSYANVAAGTSAAQGSAIAAIGTFPATQVNFGNFSSVNQHLNNPLAKQSDFGVEYQISKDYVIKASYVGIWGEDLEVTLPINLVPAANRPAPATSYADELARLSQFKNAFGLESGTASGSIVNNRLDHRFNTVTEVESIGTSNYQGLQVVVVKQPSHGLSVQGSYSYGHSIDDVSDALNVLINDTPTVQDPTNLRGNRASSEFDIRHRFVFNHVYELPFTNHLQGTSRKLFHGWAVSGIFSFQTGLPATILSGARSSLAVDQALLGNVVGALQSVYANGDPRQLHPVPQGSPAAPAILSNPCARGAGNQKVPDPNNPGSFITVPCTNTSGYFLTQPLLGNLGTSSRNLLRLADFADYDAGLLKDTKITEKLNLQFRWEVYNVFNHPNFSGFVNTLTSPSFGTYTSTASNERQMQYSVKILF